MLPTVPQYPQFKAHKTVQAFKIKAVEQTSANQAFPGGSWEIIPEDAALFVARVEHSWFEKHRPLAGGYFVQYADGYKSFSPAKAFEEGYILIDNDSAIEREIVAKGKIAPRVTPADIEALITHTFYANLGDAENANWPDPNARDEFHPALAMTTVCTLVTKNGHSVVGVAYCADPAKFNAQTGCDTARADAIRQLWPMVIYGERLAAAPSIKLTPAEIQSGHDRVRWAEGLIRQLPVDHDGRNSWLLNYSTKA